MTGHIYRDVILEQHVRLFRGAMGAEFLFMDDNTLPHHANIVDECLQSEDITRMDWPAYSLDLNSIEHVWDMHGRRIAARQPPAPCLPTRGHGTTPLRVKEDIEDVSSELGEVGVRQMQTELAPTPAHEDYHWINRAGIRLRNDPVPFRRLRRFSPASSQTESSPLETQ
ncbi:transposable element Tcb1 transposase [Trichonephila clavipes]|nr:transposable element Tcb1 transposase [Trichonephila clavipes]